MFTPEQLQIMRDAMIVKHQVAWTNARDDDAYWKNVALECDSALRALDQNIKDALALQAWCAAYKDHTRCRNCKVIIFDKQHMSHGRCGTCDSYFTRCGVDRDATRVTRLTDLELEKLGLMLGCPTSHVMKRIRE